MPNNSSIDRQAIKEQLVQTYSRKYGSEVDAENAVEEFLKFCSDRTELFVPTAEDQFKFFHRSFFEYFYARYIFLNCQTEQAVIQELLRFDVDSEVFELIVAMLKQQSETRYQALIELLFERSEQELAENRQDFPVFNILILSMQVIDDVDYRQRFLQIILSHRSLLLTNWRNIHNLKLLRSIYENDDEAYNALCEVYWQDGALFLFSGCCKIAFAAKKYDEELRERFFSMEARTVRNAMQRRNLSSRSINLDHYFYLPVFTKCVDCAQLLDSADAAMLRTVFQAANPKTASRKAVEAAEALELYRSLPKKAQEQFIQLVLSYDQ